MMGRLQDLADAATIAINGARSAVEAFYNEFHLAVDQVKDLDNQKEAYDNLVAKVSAQSAQLADVTTKVELAKKLRDDLTQLRNG